MRVLILIYPIQLVLIYALASAVTYFAVSFRYSEEGVWNSEEREVLRGTRFGGLGLFKA
jgi:hypothetical protein